MKPHITMPPWRHAEESSHVQDLSLGEVSFEKSLNVESSMGRSPIKTISEIWGNLHDWLWKRIWSLGIVEGRVHDADVLVIAICSVESQIGHFEDLIGRVYRHRRVEVSFGSWYRTGRVSSCKSFPPAPTDPRTGCKHMNSLDVMTVLDVYRGSMDGCSDSWGSRSSPTLWMILVPVSSH